MIPERHNGAYVLRRNAAGAMTGFPFRTVAEKKNPGTIMELTLTGDYYIKNKEGEFERISDGQTIRELRVFRSGVLFEPKAKR